MRSFRPRLILSGLSALAALAVAPANAQTDRIIDTPTGWIYGYGSAPSSIDTNIGSGWRPFLIQRVASDSYNVVSVSNTGDFAIPGFSTAHTYWAVTPASLSSSLAGERILDLECFELNNTTYMSAISIPNSGAQADGWGWLYDQTSVQPIADWISNSSTPLRIIDLERYSINGQERWAAVAVANQGAQSQGWWWYFDQTASQVSSLLSQNGARLIDIEVQVPPTLFTEARFAVVMVSQNPGGGWWHPSLTSSQVADLHNQTGSRITCLEQYVNGSGQTRFAVATVDNANDQTRRVRDLMDQTLDNGVYGFTLKQVGGPTIASLHENFAFEPASMLKILHGAYAVRQCSLNQDALVNDVLIRDRCNNDECPDTTSVCNSGNEDLQVAIAEMLQQSDNNRTMEIELRYGRSTLNSFAAARGLAATSINHRLGCLCGNPFNSFTCADATRLYEQIADGTLFSEPWRDVLFGTMLNTDDYGYTYYPTLNSVISQEAASTGLTSAEILDFKRAMRMANKGGGYSCDGVYYRTEGAWASVPFKVNLGQLGYLIVPREYAIAAFVHGNTSDADSRIPYSMKEEILREQIREALQSWDLACAPIAINNQPDTITRTVGQSASFTVGFTGTVTTRQWQKSFDGMNSWFNITGDPGAIQSDTTATIAFGSVTTATAGYYRCQLLGPCGSATSAVARLIVNPACTADFNGSGSITVQDIFDFLAAYFASSGAADFNNSGSITVQDIFDFLAAYFAGC